MIGRTNAIKNTPPIITTQPSAVSNVVGNIATFTVAAENACSYQWYYANSETGTGTLITGATSASYSTTTTFDMTGRYYYCVVTNGDGSVESNRALLTTNYAQLINYTMMYDNGDECTSLTGGWYKRTGTFAKLSDHMTLASASAQIYATNQISFSQYSKYHAILKGDSTVPVALMCTNTSYSNLWTVTEASIPSTAKTILSRDLSEASATTTLLGIGIGASTATLNIYNAVLTKADAWSNLCSKAGVSPPSTLASLLSNNASLTTILNNNDAVNFMIKQCTGDFMLGAIASSTFLSAYNASPYKTTIQANAYWAKFLAMIA